MADSAQPVPDGAPGRGDARGRPSAVPDRRSATGSPSVSTPDGRSSSLAWIRIPLGSGRERWSWRAGPMTGRPARAGRAVAAHCRLVLEAAGEECVAVKPQVACFERLGAPGWAALAEVVHEAAQRGLIVIADGKRGDIDISARAYAQAFFGVTPTPFGDVPGLGADALTVSPLLGRDSLVPFVQAARERGGRAGAGADLQSGRRRPPGPGAGRRRLGQRGPGGAGR